MMAFSMFMLVSCGDTDDDDDGGKKKDVRATLNGKTPEQLYDAALEKLATIDNFDMTATQVIKMT
jgi:hypothetical protein